MTREGSSKAANQDNLPLILHIGYPRTATTLFQIAQEKQPPTIRFLGRKVTGREHERWYAPQLFSYWEWVRLGKVNIDVQEAKSAIDLLLEQAGREGMVSAVISDETMSKPQRCDWYQGMVERLSSLFPNAKILLTLRNQVNLVSSLYGLYMRETLDSDLPLLTFSEWFLEGAGSSYIPLADRFNYAALYAPLQEHFGKENIHVLTFEELKGDWKEYLAKLGKILNCPNFSMTKDVRVNSSPNIKTDMRMKRKLAPKSIARLYGYKHFGLALGVVERIVLRDRRIHWDRYGINEEGKRIIAELFVRSNEKFSEISGIDLAKLGYPSLTDMRKKYIYYQQG